jgi:signal transduction histidine kinase
MIQNNEQQLQADVQLIQNIAMVPTLLDVVCRTTHLGFAAIARVNEQRWITCSVHDEIHFGLKPGDELKVETTICHEIRQSHQPVIIDDVRQDETYCHHHTPAMYGFRSYISVPIFRKDGSFFGTLCAIDPKPSIVNTPEIIGMFNLFADLISYQMQAIEQLEEGKLNLLKEQQERAFILEQKNAELHLTNAELESFAYVASHDLQEPLRKIKTFSNNLLEKEYSVLSENGKIYFNRLLASVSRMQHLIEDLLAYTKINSGERTFEEINLTDVVHEIKKDYADDPVKQFVIIKTGELCKAKAIYFQMQQLFRNLINNSVKFSRPGIDPEINITAIIEKGSMDVNDKMLPGKDYCHIKVSDNGIGFDQQYDEKIFKIFQRLHGKHEYEGTGIGLSIVKKIIDNHKGFITATGKVNEGATFDIYLPSIQ